MSKYFGRGKGMKKTKPLTNADKTKLGHETFQAFFNQFDNPDDTYTKIVLEELFGVLYAEKTLSISRKKRQKGS